MKSSPSWMTHRIGLAVCVVLAAAVSPARAQNSSLILRSGNPLPMTLANYSLTYDPPAEREEIRLHDVITVIVSEQSMFLSEGETDRKKKASVTAVLKDWVLLRNFTLFPDPQSRGDPKISASLDNKMKSEGGLETRDSMKFRIACHVVSIRPNGNLILEGLRTIENNNETWYQALAGEIRPEDLLPNNTVLSENLANLRIRKWEAGSVRDGYRRGWFLHWLDKYQPF